MSLNYDSPFLWNYGAHIDLNAIITAVAPPEPPVPVVYPVYIHSIQSTSQPEGSYLTPTPYRVHFSATTTSNGITLEDEIAFKLSSAGVYQIIYSLQLDKGTTGTPSNHFYTYLTKNGNVIPNTMTQSVVTNTTENVLCSSTILTLNANDEISVYVYVDNTGGNSKLFADSTSVPETPCAVMNIVRLGEIPPI